MMKQNKTKQKKYYKMHKKKTARTSLSKFQCIFCYTGNVS